MSEYKFKQKADVIQTLLDKTESMPEPATVWQSQENVNTLELKVVNLQGHMTKAEANVNMLQSQMNYLNNRTTLPSNYTADEEGIYRRERDNGNVYPVIHPDLSTQPSRLPYRFGNMNIYEVLIPLSGMSMEAPGILIPFDTFPEDNKVIHASVFSFETGMCAPAMMVKNELGWFAAAQHNGAISATYDYLRLQYLIKEDAQGSGSVSGGTIVY